MDWNTETVHRSPQSTPAKNVLGKTVVIAGDVAGIGRAAAQLLVENGAKIFIAVSTPAELSSVFSAVAKTGGEWDGMAVDLTNPVEIQRLFDQAERRLGRIDIFINALTPDMIPVTSSGGMLLDSADSPQTLCVNEAVERMRVRRGGNVINIRLPGQANLPAHLRREATENGIRMTVIEQGAASVYGLGSTFERPRAEEVAQCIFEVLMQPFRMDVILLHGHLQ
jgi:hypothetical protein